MIFTSLPLSRIRDVRGSDGIADTNPSVALTVRITARIQGKGSFALEAFGFQLSCGF
jgi:hypothetical protein